jgi:FliA/WhiG family RNA polymerase sigma factor
MAEIEQVGGPGIKRAGQGGASAAGGGAAAKALAMVATMRERVMAMPSGRRNWLLASVAFLAAAVAGLIWFAGRPDWRVLFSGLDGKDAQQVSQELAAAGIPYETTADGGGIRVPADMLDKARMEVAAKGNAQFRIRGAILDSLRTLDWSPRELRRKGRAVEEAIRSVTQRVGRAPSEQEIASEMDLTLGEYQLLLGDLKGLEIGSLHMERSEDSGDEELAYIPGSPEDDPLFRCLKGEMRQRLADAIDDLPEKERLVLTLYYYEELTMKEIGLALGVVESRVSQIHSSAVVRLRAALADLRDGVEPGKKGVVTLRTTVRPTTR